MQKKKREKALEEEEENEGNTSGRGEEEASKTVGKIPWSEMCDPLTVTTQFISKGPQLSNGL